MNLSYLQKKHLPAILEIEKESFPYPWGDDDFRFMLQQKNTIGLVAEEAGVRGYVVYEYRKHWCEIHNLAVAAPFRLCGVGRAMVEAVKAKATEKQHRGVLLYMGERNLVGQKFCSRVGFLATKIERNRFDTCEDDAYRMVLRLTVPSWHGKNRLTQYFQTGDVA